MFYVDFNFIDSHLFVSEKMEPTNRSNCPVKRLFGLIREINAQYNDDFLNYSFQISFHCKNKSDGPHRHRTFILLYHLMSCTLKVKQIFEWPLPKERDRTSSVPVDCTSCTLYCFRLVKTKQSWKEFVCKMFCKLVSCNDENTDAYCISSWRRFFKW
jgi:hypothetical protein